MPDAWILPHHESSILWVRPDATHYRDAERPLVNKGPIPMPPHAVHWLDIERDRLVYAHEGKLHVLRGLSGQTPPEMVKIPGKPRIHAFEVIDDVLFTGADGGKSMLGFMDLRAPLSWKAIPVTSDVNWGGKGIDGFAVHQSRLSRLIAVDDIVLPRYLLLLDITNPREPKWIEHRDLPAHSSGERVLSVVSNEEKLILLSSTANHGSFAQHIAFMHLGTLGEYATLSVQGTSSIRKWAERSYDFHAIALQGERLLIAAGKDGIGFLSLPPCPPEGPAPRKTKHRSLAEAPRISEDTLRFVPVSDGVVVGVVSVDDTRAFAIVEKQSDGLFKRKRLESVLVSLPPSNNP